MVVVQASKISFSNSSSLLSPFPHPHTHTPSILFEPSSLSLALTHSDSSLSLYPSFSPPFNSLHPTLIPSPSSSSTFLLLQSPSSPIPTVLFLVSSPYRSQILLRFFLLRRSTNSFVQLPRVLCPKTKTLRFQPNLGVLLDSKHGLSVRVSASVNYFALYSLSSSKVWVFGAQECHDDDDSGGGGGCLKLMRCAVVECERPVWSLSVAFGFLLLGEENWVRVFGLQRLVKGKVVAKRVGNSKHVRKRGGGEGVSEMVHCNGGLEGRINKHGVAGR